MRALVLQAPGKLEFRTKHPEPHHDPSWVCVRVAACGICGSDLPRAFEGKAYQYPLVMGHELSGVVETGTSGGRYRSGDRVAVFPLIPKDRNDPAVQTGDLAQARDYDYLGSRRDGGMAERVWAPEENLFPVPSHVNLLHAAMTEPAAVALHAVRRLQRLTAGAPAVVFGGGPIGNLTAQWLRIQGADPVFVVDLDERKLEVAAGLGLVPVYAGRVDPVEEIRRMTGKEGAAVSVEAVGIPATFLQAIQSASRGGEVVFLGNIAGEFRIGEKDFSDILRKELTIHGTWNSKPVPRGRDDWTTVLRFLDRELMVEPLISDTPDLEQGVEIFTSLRDRERFHNKVIFKVSRDLLSL